MSSNNSGNQTFTRVVNSAAPVGDLYVDSVVADTVVADNQVIKQAVGYLPSGTTALGSYWLVNDSSASAQTSGTSPDASVLLLPPNTNILSVVLTNVNGVAFAGPTVALGTIQWTSFTPASAPVNICAATAAAVISTGATVGLPTAAFAAAATGTTLDLNNTSSVGVVATLASAVVSGGTLRVIITYV